MLSICLKLLLPNCRHFGVSGLFAVSIDFLFLCFSFLEHRRATVRSVRSCSGCLLPAFRRKCDYRGCCCLPEGMFGLPENSTQHITGITLAANLLRATKRNRVGGGCLVKVYLTTVFELAARLGNKDFGTEMVRERKCFSAALPSTV